MRFHCHDVKVLGVNKSLGLISMVVEEVMTHQMYHVVLVVR